MSLQEKLLGLQLRYTGFWVPVFWRRCIRGDLIIEFMVRGIHHEVEKSISLTYKGHEVGWGRLDFLVANCLIVELKAVQNLAPIHEAQLLSYLKITNLSLGLLVNFNVPLLKDGIKRIIL